MDHTKCFYEVLEIHSRKNIGQHIKYLLIHCHVLEIQCSSLHHIPDIVELDINVLQLFMEQKVF